MLTVIVLTKNEEKNIVQVIENAKQVTDDVLVIDSGSTDKTCELARESGARVEFRAWDNDFASQRNFGLDKTDADWVLYLDADERMNDELVNSVKEIIKSDEYALYDIERRNSAFGKDFRYGVLGPDSVKRLFPREMGKWEGKVHESVKSTLPVKTLRGYIKHYTYSDYNEYLNKMNVYSTIGATNNFEKGKRANFITDILLRPILAFVKMFILKGGFLEGWIGFVLCLEYANYTMNKYIKLKMLQDGKVGSK